MKINLLIIRKESMHAHFVKVLDIFRLLATLTSSLEILSVAVVIFDLLVDHLTLDLLEISLVHHSFHKLSLHPSTDSKIFSASELFFPTFNNLG